MRCFNCERESTKKCSKCKSAWYCSRRCQEADYPRHKLNCGSGKQPKTIETHGQGTDVVHECNEDVKKLVTKMKLDPEDCSITMPVKELQGEYNRSHINVSNVIKSNGGSPVTGWMFYENEHMVKAEARCVWRPKNGNYLINVTPNSDGKQYSGLFVGEEFIIENGQFPPNKVLLK